MRDEQGQHISAKQVIEWTSMHSEVPVFGFWDFSIGEGKAIEKIRPQVAKKGRYILSKAEMTKHQLTIPQEIKRTITWVK